MTIAVVWQEDEVQWCAADTRLVAGRNDAPLTEIAAKIYAIPVAISALGAEVELRAPHYRTQYGFVFAGSASPASMTAITASTFLQKLARVGNQENPPKFEQIAEFVHRLAKSFMEDRRRFGGDGMFSAAFFGWCPHSNSYKVAHIEGRNDSGSVRVDLSYPPRPQIDGDPWLVLGGAASTFWSTLIEYKRADNDIRKRVPRRIIDVMVAEGRDRTVGGATSLGMAHPHGFELFYSAEPVTPGQPLARRLFNGLDLDTEVGQIGQYFVAVNGLA
jgi:hypothetical protein